MPVGAAALGAAVVGGGASLIASSNASDTAQETSAANNALTKQIYDQNSANLQPYIQQGTGATNALTNKLVGTPLYDTYVQNNPDLAAAWQSYATSAGIDPTNNTAMGAWGQQHYEQYGKTEGRTLPTSAQTGPNVAPRPDTPARPTVAPRQDYTRPTLAAPDTSLAAYQESPDLQFQMDRGMGALQSSKSLNGLLHSGDAVKSALGFSQNLALGDYNQWKASTLGQYNTDAARSDANFNSDRGYGADIYTADANRSDANFNTDAARTDANYNSDRGYAADQYNTNTNDLLALSGQGMSGASALAGVGQNYASTTSANNNAAASTSANAGLAAAGQVNGLLSNAAYAYGRSSYGQPASGSAYITGSAGPTGTNADWAGLV